MNDEVDLGLHLALLKCVPSATAPRFLSRPFIMRVPFFLILSFNKGTLKQEGQKGTTQEPRSIQSDEPMRLNESPKGLALDNVGT